MPQPLRQSEYYSDSYGNVKVYPAHVIRKKKIVKRFNPLKLILRFIFTSFLLCIFSYFAAPFLYFNYFEPLVVNHFLNRNIKIDIEPYVSRHLNYLYNSELFGKHLIVPVNHNTKTMIPIITSGELSITKKQLFDLFKKYPNMQPAVYVWEYSSAKEVSINSDVSFPAASIIKLPILFELFRKIDRSEKDGSNSTLLSKKILYDFKNKTEGSGELQYRPLNKFYTVDYLAKIMITHSDNSATNMLIEEAGGKSAVNSSMRSLGLDKIELQNRLPDLNGTNKISAKQIATLLYNLDNPNFLSDKSKITIKEYMANVQNRSLLQAGLPQEAILIHKTGDIGSMLGDAGIVYTQNGKKYVVVILVKRPYNDYSARDLIQQASKIIYNNINSGIDLL